MTLRTRIAVIAAGAVALALLIVSFGVYTTTSQRLERQVDAELRRTAAAVMELGGGRATVASRLEAVARIRDERAGEGRGGRGQRPERTPAEIDRFLGPLEGGIVQLVEPDGSTLTIGSSALPVDAATLELARSGGAAHATNADVDGTTVRILSVPAGDAGALQFGTVIGDIDRALTALRRQMLLAGLLGVVLAAVFGAAVADRAVRPVRRLSDAAGEVGRTGDLSTRIAEPGGEDELARLARSFNGMLASLELARRSQQQLVADASHELRTPLTSLRTNIEVLQLPDELSVHDRTALLRDVTLQLEEFGRLVDGLVELARGDEPARAPTRVRLADVVADVVDRMAVLAPDVEVEVTADDSHAMVERDRLERALRNLVDNAVKHGGGGTVQVTVADGAVAVRDHGPGIADGDLDHVFERFYRSPEARQRPGSGLGLSIVAQVAEAHGGSVQLRNHPDGGAQCTLSLPSA